MLFILFGVLILLSRVPFLMQSEKSFLRLLTSFFRGIEYLMTNLRWDSTRLPTRWDNWVRAYHIREVKGLPKKLGAWARIIDTGALPGTTVIQLQVQVIRLQALSYRMQELMAVRDSPQAEFLIRELLKDVGSWRLRAQAVLKMFAKNPAAMTDDSLREGLTIKMERMEQRIEDTLNKAGEGEFDDSDVKNFYRLIGAYRGYSEAMIEYAGTAGNIEWERWRETRF